MVGLWGFEGDDGEGEGDADGGDHIGERCGELGGVERDREHGSGIIGWLTASP